MRMVVGLGNPGPTYRRTRHNVGFRVVAEIAKQHRAHLRPSPRYKSSWTRVSIEQEETTLLLPNTYMNRSGEALTRWLRKLQLPLDNVLVIVDDLQLPLGQLRIRAGGSDGGHQGLRSIIESVGSRQFSRLRLGIDAPKDQMAWEEYVLERFQRDEEPLVEQMVSEAVDCCRLWVTKGTQHCANQFNVKAGKDETV